MALNVLMALLVIGYVGINFVAPIPPGLIAQNLAWAIIYLALLAAVMRGLRWAYLATALIAAFNAGRVSRSVWTPTLQLEPLALQHVPLLAVLLLVSLLSAICLTRSAR